MIDPIGAVLFVLGLGLLLGCLVVLGHPATRPRSMADLGTVVALTAAVALGTIVASRATDDSVAIRGRTVFCETPLFEDPLPAEVRDRCAAQRSDRLRQMLLAAGGASITAAAAVTLALARSRRAP